MRTFLKYGTGIIPCENWQPNCWVNIENPSEADKSYLFNDLQIPESFYNDIEDIDERPRIEIENGWYLILIRVPYKTNDISLPFSTAPMGIIFRGDIFVSISFNTVELLSDFVQYSQRKNVKIKDDFDLVLRILLSSSVWFLKYLKQINQKIKLAEKQLERSIRNEDLQTLLQIEKCMVFFTTSLKGNDILIHRIKNLKDYKDTFDPELFEDVEIESRQAQETTKIYSDILSGMMDAYASVISNNLNVIMKVLTSISIILMIPTVVASFYGMNVPNSLQSSKYGFLIVLLISLMLSTVGVIFFRRKKWF